VGLSALSGFFGLFGLLNQSAYFACLAHQVYAASLQNYAV
jgi:hypothetical protein